MHLMQTNCLWSNKCALIDILLIDIYIIIKTLIFVLFICKTQEITAKEIICNICKYIDILYILLTIYILSYD